MEYNYAMRYLNGKSALKSAKEVWPKKNPYENKSYILQWKNACIDKGIIESKIKRKIKKRINYEEFTKEQLIKIIKKYKEFEKIKKNGKNKKLKFKFINHQNMSSITIIKWCKLFNVSKSGYYKWKTKSQNQKIKS